jgi:hypothetical protein
MNHSPAKVLAEAIISASLGSDVHDHAEWPVVDEFMPDLPDGIIAVYSTSGLAGTKGMKTGGRSSKPGFEILVRAMENDDAWQKIEAVSNWLSKTLKRTVVSVEEISYRIESITLVGTTTFIGLETEGKRRPLFSLNGRVTISQI